VKRLALACWAIAAKLGGIERVTHRMRVAQESEGGSMWANVYVAGDVRASHDSGAVRSKGAGQQILRIAKRIAFIVITCDEFTIRFVIRAVYIHRIILSSHRQSTIRSGTKKGEEMARKSSTRSSKAEKFL